MKPSDFYDVTSVIQSWWRGRDLREKLPKLFFEHFQQTSFVVVEKGTDRLFSRFSITISFR
ncbi:hypothetical protein [Bacillus sp. Bos-x628]|uniref:hypothetical protein n=1 Tax=Bacillus maqinnsis TaxID=3229854 RepID=UPI00338F3493